jgi:hypothetical protein
MLHLLGRDTRLHVEDASLAIVPLAKSRKRAWIRVRFRPVPSSVVPPGTPSQHTMTGFYLARPKFPS